MSSSSNIFCLCSNYSRSNLLVSFNVSVWRADALAFELCFGGILRVLVSSCLGLSRTVIVRAALSLFTAFAAKFVLGSDGFSKA